MHELLRVGRIIVNQLRLRDSAWAGRLEEYKMYQGAEVANSADFKRVFDMACELSARKAAADVKDGLSTLLSEVANVLPTWLRDLRPNATDELQQKVAQLVRERFDQMDIETDGIAPLRSMQACLQAMESKYTESLLQSILNTLVEWQTRDTSSRMRLAASAFLQKPSQSMLKDLVDLFKTGAPIPEEELATLVADLPNAFTWMCS